MKVSKSVDQFSWVQQYFNHAPALQLCPVLKENFSDKNVLKLSSTIESWNLKEIKKEPCTHAHSLNNLNTLAVYNITELFVKLT